jgi:hypothetical protein
MMALAPIIVMFDGIETGRHLFLFNMLLDVTICAVIALGFSVWTAAGERCPGGE